MIEPPTAVIASRFVFDSAALLLWGAGLFCWLIAPKELGAILWKKLAAARMVTVVLICLAVATMLPARAASLGDGWTSALDGKIIWLILVSTSVGSAWLVSAGTALVLIIVLAARRDHSAVSSLLAAVLLCSTVLTGHSAMSEGWLKAVHQANSALHVLSAGAWIGALVPVLMILPGLREDKAGLFRDALMRFSTLGHLVVSAVIVSGVLSSVLILGGLPLEISSTYQLLLWIKIAVVAAMVGVAIANRYVFVPRLRAKTGALNSLVMGTIMELLLASLAIGLVAWFGTLSPMNQHSL